MLETAVVTAVTGVGRAAEASRYVLGAQPILQTLGQTSTCLRVGSLPAVTIAHAIRTDAATGMTTGTMTDTAAAVMIGAMTAATTGAATVIATAQEIGTAGGVMIPR